MSDELNSAGFWLAHFAASAPVLLMLGIGLVVCYRQRHRRPRMAQLVGFALLAQLFWMVVGIQLFNVAIRRLGVSMYSPSDHFDEADWMVRFIVINLPHSIISAATWGTVLWAVLQVDDWQENSTRAGVRRR